MRFSVNEAPLHARRGAALEAATLKHVLFKVNPPVFTKQQLCGLYHAPMYHTHTSHKNLTKVELSNGSLRLGPRFYAAACRAVAFGGVPR
jgi:hypothetical protein